MGKNERIEINDDVLEGIAGGNIRVSTANRTVTNTSTGAVYHLADGVDPGMVAMFVFSNYNGDSDAIAQLYSKNWIL